MGEYTKSYHRSIMITATIIIVTDIACDFRSLTVIMMVDLHHCLNHLSIIVKPV